MKVLVAGASGVIGRPLVRRLVAAGHAVTGMTSRERNAAAIEAAGGRAVVCDALDPDAVKTTVAEAAPEVVISQLTRLPADYNPRKIDYGPSNRAREVGGRNLIAAGREAGARRFVTQSIAFIYAPEGGMVKDEEARPWADAPEPFTEGAKSTLDHERDVLEAPGIDGLVLRYGQFYGPGTYYASDGSSPTRSVDVAFRSWARAAGRSRSSTRKTPPRPRWRPSTAGRPASTTSSTTSPPPNAIGCPSTPRRWARSLPARSRPGWRGSSPGGSP